MKSKVVKILNRANRSNQALIQIVIYSVLLFAGPISASQLKFASDQFVSLLLEPVVEDMLNGRSKAFDGRGTFERQVFDIIARSVDQMYFRSGSSKFKIQLDFRNRNHFSQKEIEFYVNNLTSFLGNFTKVAPNADPSIVFDILRKNSEGLVLSAMDRKVKILSDFDGANKRVSQSQQVAQWVAQTRHQVSSYGSEFVSLITEVELSGLVEREEILRKIERSVENQIIEYLLNRGELESVNNNPVLPSNSLLVAEWPIYMSQLLENSLKFKEPVMDLEVFLENDIKSGAEVFIDFFERMIEVSSEPKLVDGTIEIEYRLVGGTGKTEVKSLQFALHRFLDWDATFGTSRSQYESFFEFVFYHLGSNEDLSKEIILDKIEMVFPSNKELEAKEKVKALQLRKLRDLIQHRFGNNQIFWTRVGLLPGANYQFVHNSMSAISGSNQSKKPVFQNIGKVIAQYSGFDLVLSDFKDNWKGPNVKLTAPAPRKILERQHYGLVDPYVSELRDGLEASSDSLIGSVNFKKNSNWGKKFTNRIGESPAEAEALEALGKAGDTVALDSNGKPLVDAYWATFIARMRPKNACFLFLSR